MRAGASAEDSEPGIDPLAEDEAIEQEAHQPGDVLAGKYRLIRMLGEGGMGAVWRARSLVLDVDVAIKVLRREIASRDLAARLRREARAAARIKHGSIVRVFDFGQSEQGEPFLVMELLEGRSLADELDDAQRLPPNVAVQLLLPVADAIAAAHEQGVIHRDIKPENILIVSGVNGTKVPKLVDFGIVKLAADAGERSITQAGMLMGSPEYMSPEQSTGRGEVGPAADIWAFTVVLYEVLMGKRPFKGPSFSAVLYSIFHRELAPITSIPGCDEELWRIVKKGLAPELGDRWANMRSLGGELAKWAVKHDILIDATGASIERVWLDEQPSSRKNRASLTGEPASRPSFQITVPPIVEGKIDEEPSAYESAPPAPKRRRAIALIAPIVALTATIGYFIAAGAKTRAPAAAVAPPPASAASSSAEEPKVTPIATAPAPTPVLVATTAPSASARAVSSAAPRASAKAAPIKRNERGSMPIPTDYP